MRSVLIRSEYEFEKSLDELMDLISKTSKRVAWYSLSSDTIADHVLETMDNTRNNVEEVIEEQRPIEP